MILDTNALSVFVDGEAAVGEALRRQERAAIPAVVLGEFRYGIAQSRRRATYEAWLESELLFRRSARSEAGRLVGWTTAATPGTRSFNSRQA